RESLKHDSRESRLFAINIVGQGEVNREVAEIFVEAVKDPDATIRKQVLEGLGKAADPDTQKIAFTALINALHGEKDETVQATGLTSLKKLGSPPDSEMPAVVKCLDHPRAEVRLYAVQTLGKMSPAAESVARLQKVALDQKADEDLRRQA